MNSFLQHNKQIVVFAVLFVLVLAQAHLFAQTKTQANTTISNFANKASYEDDLRKTFETVSETVQIEVKGVSSIVVTPDETSPSEIVTANQTIVREFRICNTGNLLDSYTITQLNVTSPAHISGILRC